MKEKKSERVEIYQISVKETSMNVHRNLLWSNPNDCRFPVFTKPVRIEIYRKSIKEMSIL